MKRNRRGNATAAVLICIILCIALADCRWPETSADTQARIKANAEVKIHQLDLEKARVELEREKLKSR